MRELLLPLSVSDRLSLRAYDRVLFTGTLLVGRDQVHQRLADARKNGRDLPISLAGETLYYMGPAATPEGMVIGSCGPTTSARMDPFTGELYDAGLVATIGKGPRNDTVVEAIVRNRGIYFVAYGGCGALYAKTVQSVSTVAFADLGPEALLQLAVFQFPALVGIDSMGNSVFQQK